MSTSDPTASPGSSGTSAGRISTFDVPGARGTEAVKLNDRRQIVGRYSEDTPFVDDSARVRGYIRHRGKTTRIDVATGRAHAAHRHQRPR